MTTPKTETPTQQRALLIASASLLAMANDDSAAILLNLVSMAELMDETGGKSLDGKDFKVGEEFVASTIPFIYAVLKDNPNRHELLVQAMVDVALAELEKNPQPKNPEDEVTPK